MDDDRLWQEMYRNNPVPPLPGTILGFNANIDCIIQVTPDLLASQAFLRPELAEFRTRLFTSMRTCTAEEWFVKDRSFYRQFSGIFSGTGTTRIGGQAGIAACSLAQLGAREVFCMVPGAGAKTRSLLSDAGIVPLTFNAGRNDASDTVHHVFEYSPGIVTVQEGVTPRSNRFIVSPEHGPGTVLVPEEAMDRLASRISTCTRAFLSGYQYLRTPAEFGAASRQIRELKRAGNGMRVHVECVTISEPAVLDGLYQTIFPEADSLGMNEHELAILVSHMKNRGTEPGCGVSLSPAGLVQGAVELCRKTGVTRLHVHTFGWYVLVMKKQYSHPDETMRALLSASLVASGAAHGRKQAVSSYGIRVVSDISQRYAGEGLPGVFSTGGHIIHIIPSCIADDPKTTCGLGDILSSTAFAADTF